MKPKGQKYTFEELVDIMARLRDPVSGCPWDREQNFKTIAPYTLEEAYEVADAIDRNDMGDLREELGDLLLQPVYHAQMASEAGSFNIEDVVDGIACKMVERHPHVFGDASVRAERPARKKCKCLGWHHPCPARLTEGAEAAIQGGQGGI